VERRDVLGFAENEKRKNRKSHRSQRNGRTKIKARSILSAIPLRLDWWMRTLLHSGQLIIPVLLKHRFF
jgi:hypothetical protein